MYEYINDLYIIDNMAYKMRGPIDRITHALAIGPMRGNSGDNDQMHKRVGNVSGQTPCYSSDLQIVLQMPVVAFRHIVAS